MPLRTKVREYQELKHEFNRLIGPVHFDKNINLKLERITHLLDLIGNPHNSFPSIHISGTSGKGSTASMAARILSFAGYKTGLHISPHLQIINERFQINGKMVDSHKLLNLFNKLKPAIAEVAEKNPFGQPSYFEVQVALAFSLFKEEGVDIAVVEVGLGGKLDATNVLNAQVAVITNIGLDHTHILGDTVELIAQDKSGIIKPGQYVISGATQPTTKQIIADRCKSQNAILWQFGEQINLKNGKDDEKFSLTTPGRVYTDLQITVPGNFQVKNAACALAAVHAFDPSIPDSTIQESLNSFFIPGRMEIVQVEPTIILDGAHNPNKIKAASDALQKHFPDKKRIVIFALKKGKAYKDVLALIVENTETIIITEFVTELWDPYEPEFLKNEAKKIKPDLDIRIQQDSASALDLAKSLANQDDIILVTGSLYLVGNMRFHWFPLEKILN
jgi:dihydrofolate synthase/folylpolyglutamate synthase